MTARRALVAAGLVCAAAIAVCTPAKPGRAKPAAHPDPQAGKAVFDHWCAPCHGPNPRLAGTLALQTKYQGTLPAALEQRRDLTPAMIALFVREGVAWMAPFRKTEISDAELAALGAYLSRPKAARPKKDHP